VTQHQLVASSTVTFTMVQPDFDDIRRTPELSDISRDPKVVALFSERFGALIFRVLPTLHDSQEVRRET
jgi:hypothetical protein